MLALRIALDALLFPASSALAQSADAALEVPVGGGRSVMVRRYGPENSADCALFFPGQHGALGRYEVELFPRIQDLGITIHALSYPGQDGAAGPARLEAFKADMDTALATIAARTRCSPERTLFIGRSFGATVAILEAADHRPCALILDGVSPSLLFAIRAAFRRHWYSYAWSALPIEAFLTESYSVVPALHRLDGTPTTIFQGVDDDITPLEDLRPAIKNFPSVALIPVPGGRHEDAYLKVFDLYLERLATECHDAGVTVFGSRM